MGAVVVISQQLLPYKAYIGNIVHVGISSLLVHQPLISNAYSEGISMVVLFSGKQLKKSDEWRLNFISTRKPQQSRESSGAGTSANTNMTSSSEDIILILWSRGIRRL